MNISSKIFWSRQTKGMIVLNAIRDEVNKRFGRGSMQTARAMQVPSLTDVIAPAWKPDGVRNSVQTETAQKGDGRKRLH